MKDLRGTYVHRGDVERRKRRTRGAFMLLGLGVTALLAARNWEPREAEAEPLRGSIAERAEIHRLRTQLETARGELSLAAERLERWQHIFRYAQRFRISSDLSSAIYDAALAEGIDPALAFPLIRLESRFNDKAVSSVGAVGLAQLMLPTARYYLPGVTREQLFDRETNLRIGFRHLRDLIREQRGNVQLALLVYNRGPSAVEVSQELGLDPSNGYDRIVLKDYKGKGVID
jgi:soluble lytic murein transglycosylase-like protein